MAEWKKLSPEEERVIVRKGTELPGTGEYLHTKQAGTYTCKRCGAPLYRSDDKFDSGCGWPAFDDEIAGAVKRVTNPGDSRIEILCNSCGGHLGHVFAGERLTDKNIRHCVNSISLQFVPKAQAKTEKAYFAAGCFWGVEHWFKTQPGVVRTRVGYMGGDLLNPSYRDVCSGDTGHAETLEVEFDPATTDFDTLARLFFEIHDFTQIDRQGPDIGPQYRSEIFTTSPEQDKAAENILDELRRKGYKPATKVTRAVTFWPAEEYHQDYYGKTGKMPYCHARREIFGIGARK
ncbi:MAG: bifunctional methionine sulfoxide reductase B/A protein [Planctomycetes bacterium]|nr:bifunctional methionine sulfoxide reductase B/A protein [Planctomycetota bacterium]